MLVKSKALLQSHPVRRTRAEMDAFRTALQGYALDLGYSCNVESGVFGCRNLLVGDPELADYLLMARCGENQDAQLLTLLEVMASMPENRRGKVCFILYDADGILKNGAKTHYRLHKNAAKHQLILGLDSVGSGNKLVMIPTKRLKENRRKLTSLYKANGYIGKKSLLVDETQTASMVFPYGVSIVQKKEKKKSKGGKPAKRVNPLDETNINILRAALVSFFCCDAVQ